MRSVCSNIALVCLAAVFPSTVYAQRAPLAFQPIDSKYSLALDRIIMVSANPAQLHIYDPISNSDSIVALPKAPLSLSVSPDGLHAAVMHNSLVSYVDLNAAAISQTFTVSATQGSVVLSADRIYVLAGVYTEALSITLSTGVVETIPGLWAAQGLFNPQVGTLYGIDPESSTLFENKPPTDNQMPFYGRGVTDYSGCGGIWASPDGSRIYSGCGTVFHASTDSTVDLTYMTVFPGLTYIQSIDTSTSLNLVAAVPSIAQAYTAEHDNQIKLFASEALAQVGQLSSPDFVVGGTNFPSHIKAVFFNRDSSAIYAVSQADAASGLLNGFVDTTPISPSNTCNATFVNAAASAIAAGELNTIQVDGAQDCTFSVKSNAAWIQPLAAEYLSSGNTLTYLVRPNLTAQARSGTLSIGEAAFTITQSAVAPAAGIERLSFNVEAADYSRALDKLVLVSSSPDELHIYDPLSQADRTVALLREPLSLSVSPDGFHAAVGHNGWISYVNLQTALVEQVFPISMDVSAIVLAGNGYIYPFPNLTADFSGSLEIATGKLTPTSGLYSGGSPRINASGKFIYGGGNYSYKYDISQGPAQPVIFDPTVPTCNGSWLSQDGARLFTACASVYHLSDISANDQIADGTLSAASAITWMANSQANGLDAVIPSRWPESPDGEDTVLQIYNDADLALISQTNLPFFSTDSGEYAAHGRFAFWNSTGSNLYTIVHADSTAHLVLADGVYTFTSLAPPPVCTISLNSNSLHAPASVTDAAINITTDPFCAWSAQPSEPWLELATSSGKGPAQLAITVAFNDTGVNRTGTIKIGENVLTINQDGTLSAPLPGGAETADFGIQPLGITSSPLLISVSNGGQPFLVSGLDSRNLEFYPSYGTCKSSVLNYAPCNLTVTFTPRYAFGPQHSELVFLVNGVATWVELSALVSSEIGSQATLFEIQNRLSGKVLDVTNSSTDNGARIQQWDAAGSGNQKWLVALQSDGYYIIKNQLSGKVLDVTNFSTENGAVIQQWDSAGSDNQKWSFNWLGDTYFEIVNKLSGKALDVTNFSTASGALVQQWQYEATQNQQWQLIRIGDVPAQDSANAVTPSIPAGVTTIVNRLSNKVLDVTNFSTENGTQIQQWQYAATANQKWQLEAVADGYYKIVNKLSGKVLDVRDFSKENGAAIQQWDWEHSDNQLWSIIPVDGQFFKLANKLSGLVLDMTDFSTKDGAKLQQWRDESSPNQQWSFSPVAN